MEKDLLIVEKNELSKLYIGFEIFDIYKEIDKMIKKYKFKNIQSKIFSTISINSNNNKNINNIIISKKSLFKYILIITLIFSSLEDRNIQRNLYSKYSSITLKVNHPGSSIQIYSGTYMPYRPDQIKINGAIQEFISTKYNFDTFNNEIELIWYNSLNTARSMFDNCYEIDEINFSNFYSSRITNMDYMFYNCYR